MLEASGEVVYVNEPMNPQHPPGHSPGVLDARVTHRFQYISPRTTTSSGGGRSTDTLALRYGSARAAPQPGAYDLARHGQVRHARSRGAAARRRAMLDDPFAIFSTGWLVREMGCEASSVVRTFVGQLASAELAIHFHELLGAAGACS